jgi:hypothetical protein
MFTGSQTITADKLTSMNRGWRHIDSLKEENGERAAFIKLRSVTVRDTLGTYCTLSFDMLSVFLSVRLSICLIKIQIF